MIELGVDVDPVLVDALSACLFEAGAEGVEEREEPEGPRLIVYCASAEQGDRLRAAIEDFRRRAAAAFPQATLGPVHTAPIGTEWTTAWLDALGPIRVTDEIVLRPTRCRPAPPAEQTLWYEPAVCFGSGEHPTTRLAARALERELAARGDTTTVLDVGTGNGVLCLVAAQRGARRARGIDIDPGAVDAARHNANLNDLASVCDFSTTPLEHVEGRYDVVVANIDAPTLQSLAQSLCAHLAPGGNLLLTGLLEEQENEVRRTFSALSVPLDLREASGEWLLLGTALRGPAAGATSRAGGAAGDSTRSA